MGALITLALIVGVFCGCEFVLKRMPGVDAWLDRFMGGDGEIEVLTANEWARKRGYICTPWCSDTDHVGGCPDAPPHDCVPGEFCCW